MQIVVEGCDGTGKSTVAQRIAEYINQSGRETILTKHPGATTLGQKLRFLTKYDREVEIDRLTEQILMLADYSCYVGTILNPALEGGKVVVADRSNYISGMVYGLAGGVDINRLAQLYQLLSFPPVDLLLVLYCPWEVSKARMMARDDLKCKIEERGDEYFGQVNRAYKGLLEDTPVRLYASRLCDQIIKIDASLDREQVWDQVRWQLDKVLQRPTPTYRNGRRVYDIGDAGKILPAGI